MRCERVESTLELVGITHLADTSVNALGLGHCRLVELARALAAEPKILLADEPSSGLDLHETAEVAAVLRTVQRERGTAVLLVEHDLAMVAEVVDRTVVMDLGAMLAEGTFDEVMADPLRAGRLPGSDGDDVTVTTDSGTVDERRRRRAVGAQRRAPATVRTALSSTCRSACPSGGVVALVGSNGAGKSTVARTVTGLVTASTGQVIFSGQDVTALPAYKIARLGMAHVVEGRGVFSSLTVEENLTLAFRQRAGRGKLRDNLERAYTRLPDPRRAPAPDGRARSRVGSSACCRWPRSWWCRPRCSSPTSCPWAWRRSSSTPSTRACEEINRNGTALVVVEQQVNRVLSLANWAVVLDHGSVAYEGEPGRCRQGGRSADGPPRGGRRPRASPRRRS